MVIRSFTLPVIFALLGSIGSIAVAAKGMGILSPYALMMLGMNANRAENMLTGQLVPFLASAAGYLLLFYLLSVIWLRSRDIRS